jgi:WD40 repeat protein
MLRMGLSLRCLLAASLLPLAINLDGGIECSCVEPPKPITTDKYGDSLPEGAIARLGTTRFRVSAGTLVWSPDSRVLASAGVFAGPIKLWAVATAEEMAEFEERATAIAWSPDGKLLASGREEDDLKIRIWDAATKKQVFTLEGHTEYGVESLAWSPDSTKLASAGSDKTARLWDIAARKELYRLTGHRDGVNSVAWSPDGKALATGSDDATVRLWDASTAKQTRCFAIDNTRVRSVSWSPDGSALVVQTVNSAHLWRPTDSDKVTAIRQAHSAAWSPDGLILALLSARGTIRLIESRTGKEIRRFGSEDLQLLAWSPDGKMLAAMKHDAIRLWDPKTGSEIRPLDGHEAGVTSVCWSPDGQLLASGSYDHSIRISAPATGRLVRTMIGHQGSVASVSWSSDGATIASGSWDKTIRLWNPASGKQLGCVAGFRDGVDTVAWSPDSKMLASGSADKIIRLWDLATLREIRRLPAGREKVQQLAWSPDGQVLAAVASCEYVDDPHAIHLWDARMAKEIATLPTGPTRETVLCLAWAPDGRTIAAGMLDDTIRLWEVRSRKEIARFASQTQVRTLAWSPDGRTIASGGHDNMVRLWETRSLKEVVSFRGHKDLVQSVAWSPDAKRLVSGSSDRTCLVWQLCPPCPLPDLTREELTSLWHALAGEDARRAYRAAWSLVAASGSAVRLLNENLVPVPAPNPTHVANLIADLDSEKSSVRENASTELEKLGATVETALRSELARMPSLEVRRRIERLLARMRNYSPEALRLMRAVEVLEHIGTDEAKRTLTALGNGTPESPVTQEARTSLRRLNSRE